MTLSLLIAPFAIEAQPAGKVWRIGLLATYQSASPNPAAEALHTGLREHGYVEGQNLIVERRYAEGRDDRLPALAAEFVAMRVDLMLVFGTQAALAAKAATSSIPIVLVGVLDPERTGLVASLGRPGGNITGISNQNLEIQAKQYQLFKEVVPRLSRLAVLWNPTNEASALAWKETENQARGLSMTVISGGIASPAELEQTLAAVAARRPDGLVVHGAVGPYLKRILEFASSHRLPTLVADRRWADLGALLSYGPSFPDIVRRATGYISKILRGAKPAELPVEQPTKFELVINLRTAKALGLTNTAINTPAGRRGHTVNGSPSRHSAQAGVEHAV